MNSTPNQKNTPSTKRNALKLFPSLKGMVFAAILVAISIVGKLLAFTPTESLRISFENLPIVLSGILLGPIVGFVVGTAADILGCFAMGYSINPIITLGMAFVGLIPGLVSMLFKDRFSRLNAVVSDLTAHTIGSLIIKTIGIVVYYGAEGGLLVMFSTRALFYVPTVAFEIAVLVLIFSSKPLKKEFSNL